MRTFLPIIIFFAAISSGHGQGYRSLSAQTALDQIGGRFGSGAVKWVAELRATGGQPQPSQWNVLAYNPRSAGLLHRFVAVAGVAEDGGPENRRYPAEAPTGYFSRADLGLDSVAAFTIAEAAARKARVGFDSCDYFLRVREYSREPVWRLDLVDASRRLVGQVFISGANGQLLRTVWVRFDSLTGYPKIEDSSAPGAKPYTGITGGDHTRSREIIPGQSGIASNPPPTRNGTVPFSPVAPDGSVTQAPPLSPGPAPSNRGIFREFPAEGGGSSRTVKPPVLTVPNPPPPRTPIPEKIPEIKIPSGNNSGGSTERIPPPPIPQ